MKEMMRKNGTENKNRFGRHGGQCTAHSLSLSSSGGGGGGGGGTNASNKSRNPPLLFGVIWNGN
jgi:hypothetical protein